MGVVWVARSEASRQNSMTLLKKRILFFSLSNV